LTIRPVNPIKRDWMKKFRSEKKMSIREMAESLGISHQHYNDIENGNRNPSIELAITMAEFFKVPVLRLLRDRTRFQTERLEKI
jgi:DNA-binding XRE family transcriptional regulator